MSPRAIEVRRISGALGAEIHGLDLARDLSTGMIATIRAAWLEHLVIFFRDQDLTPARFLALASSFGEPVEYPFIKGLDDCPRVTPVVKLAHETVNFGGVWHSDTTYLPQPPMATFLLAREVPPYGGDTLFASQYAAYETLSGGLKAILDGLVAVASSAKADVTRTREDRVRSDGRTDTPGEYMARHPVVRTHPETGRKSLYVNRAHTVRFDGWTETESAPLLQFLFEHQVRPEFTCRFAWRPGSLAFWDNRCTLHNPVNDYHGFQRVMHRITLAGDAPA